MKFALISQAFTVQSYKVENQRAYTLDGKPYSYPHSIGNEFFNGYWNYPFLFDGYYLNLSDLHKVNVDLDLILLANDKNKEFSTDVIRKKFPNAVIIATVKEMAGDDNVRRELFNNADAFCLPLTHDNPIAQEFQKLTDKEYNWVPQPVNIDFLYDNFYVDKQMAIFAYQHSQPRRTADSMEFSKYLGNKYNLAVHHVFTTERTHLNAVLTHLNSWSKCMFHVNMDPTFNYGNQATMLASAGTINIGSNNDTNQFLFPKTRSTDWDVLEAEFVKMINNQEYLISIVTNAFEQVNKVYSYDVVREKIINIYNKV